MMTSKPKLTLAIPTYNRLDLLKEGVDSLIEQHNQSNDWEIIIVNNNSSDNTEIFLKSYANKYERIKYFNEEIAGSSQARNRALKECRTDYILFVDDECTFKKNYIDQALDIIEKHAPKIFGGPVHARLLSEAPKWFKPEYGEFSNPSATGRSDRVFLSGANIGFKLDSILSIGGFDSNLGMFGKKMGYGEETAVEMKMLEKFGPEAVWFDPQFINYHLVRPEKYKWPYLIRENFLRGVARAKLAKTPMERIDQIVPDCLKAKKTKKSPDQNKGKPSLNNLAYEKGLPLVRTAGVIWGKIR